MSRWRKGGRLGLLACLIIGEGLGAPISPAQGAAAAAGALVTSGCFEPQFIRLAPWVTGEPLAFSEGIACLPSGDQLSEPTIFWGDGTTSVGTMTDTAGLANVSGQHTYSRPGNFDISVQLIDDSTGETLVRGWHTDVEVSQGPVFNPSSPPSPAPTKPPAPSKGADPPAHAPSAPTGALGTSVAAHGTTFHATVGRRRKETVAVLRTTVPAGSLRARISWGDGSFSRGTLRGSAPQLRVVGRHRWAHRGRYSVTVLIVNARGVLLAWVTDHVGVL